MAKKRIYKADAFAAINPKQNYGTVYADTLKSAEFNALSIAAQNLWLKLRAHAKDNEAKRALYAFCKEFNIGNVSDNCFIFTTTQAAEYGFSAPYKSRCLKELEKAGFIKTMLNNYKIRRANLYAFSDNWKKAQNIAGDVFGVDELTEDEK